MKKVIITKGLPGSGKSTWSRELMKKNPSSYKRINKDDLRAMIDDGVWSRDSEKLILKIRDAIILLALERGKHVIIDDTNLVAKHEASIRQLVSQLSDVQVEIKDFTDVPLETCIERDLKRTASVGEKVIRKMYDQFLKKPAQKIAFNKELPSCIICDLDGTLALIKDRNPYDASTSDEDDVNYAALSVLKSFYTSRHIDTLFFFTGRPERYERPTRKFLDEKVFPELDPKWNIPVKMFMRKDEDIRKDALVKEEMFRNNIEGKFNVLFVLDDRDQVVEKWRELGLNCFQVNYGNF